MRGKRFLLISALLVGTLACSCSRFGRGGKGASGDEDGNIPRAGAGSELADVNFAFDSSSLDERAKNMLRQNGTWLLDNPGQKVTVEGHCDERGTAEYNLALGERRSRATFDYLRSLGVKGDQMNTISYGEEIPLEPGHDEMAWGKNRRAHLSFR